MPTDRQTDEHMTKLIVACRNFPNAPEDNSEVQYVYLKSLAPKVLIDFSVIW